MTTTAPRPPKPVARCGHFAPMLVHPVRYLWMNRSTHSDVMSTSTTTTITTANSKNGLSIQLPSFLGKHLSSHVSVPSKRKSKALVKERDLFMQRLEQERNDRAILETWAIIRIQALGRGHLGRLRIDRLRQELGMKTTDATRRRNKHTQHNNLSNIQLLFKLCIIDFIFLQCC